MSCRGVAFLRYGDLARSDDVSGPGQSLCVWFASLDLAWALWTDRKVVLMTDRLFDLTVMTPRNQIQYNQSPTTEGLNRRYEDLNLGCSDVGYWILVEWLYNC